ncbi:MAG TPA: efflux RND transporter periplasmic adaptor subunit [Polyangiaceae bacterium]|nr:efflux RND transporter periplasmic adaptor subunit [Polyangiaceae bacterium]
MNLRLGLWFLVAALGAACRSRAGDDADDHGPGAHPKHGDHALGSAEAEGPAPLAITKWTDRYELFVEFPRPEPNKALDYHAHVTRLAEFEAVTGGKFTVRFKRDGKVVRETSIDKVERAGIFRPGGPAPARGRYALEMTYERGGESATFDCGLVDVVDDPSAAAEEPVAGEITFLKETQWKIPFHTAWSEVRELKTALEFAATVETAASDQLTLGAPISGRFFHDQKAALAVGRRVAKGEVLGRIAPNVEGEDFTRLESSVEEARLQKQQVEAEIERVTPLVEQGLLPERRSIELRNELSVQQARLRAAQLRVSRVIAPGGLSGLPIRAALDGLLSDVLVSNGEPVAAGAVLLRLAGTHHVWLRSRFVARPRPALTGAVPVAVRLSDGRRIDLKDSARFMSAEPSVDPQTRLATWVVDVAGSSAPDLEAGLQPGTSVVLQVRAGTPRKVLAVPREAVVEIATQPYVFVQSGGESFFKRRVEVGATDGEWTEIRSGIAEGERVVTEGGFDVHIASLAGTIESHRH